jgi:hypothetical protein
MSFIKKNTFKCCRFFLENVFNVSEKPFKFVHIGLKVFYLSLTVFHCLFEFFAESFFHIFGQQLLQQK